jgi:hypothetical protein
VGRKKKYDKKVRVQQRLLGFAEEPEIDALARSCGIAVRFNRSTWHGKTVTPHWIFTDRSGERHLLHYWPSTRRWWRPDDGEKGFAANNREAVELAYLTSRRVPI